MIQYFDWLPQLEGLQNVDSIENELIVFQLSQAVSELHVDMPFHFDTMRSPHKFDFFMLIKHIAGSATVKIDMDEYVLTEPINTIQIAPGQIISVDNASEDFDVVVMLMSRRLSRVCWYMSMGQYLLGLARMYLISFIARWRRITLPMFSIRLYDVLFRISQTRSASRLFSTL